ncbi:TPA: hypothetical protein ACGV8D_001745 [Enterococcus faecium]
MRSARRRHGLAVAGVALATPAETSPSLSNRGAQLRRKLPQKPLQDRME